MSQLNVIVSVDWEPDHGPWKWPGADIDYGGILKGTPAFCSILDDLRIPCTWFIESSYDPQRDLPACHAGLVRLIAARQQDEIGLHLHWRRPASGSSVIYETADTNWVGAQLDHGIRQLESLGARPRAFRSGALLHVVDLPRMLSDRGFLVDSSTLWGRANRLQADRYHFKPKPLRSRLSTVLQRVFGTLPRPYFADEGDVERPGAASIAEFPITYSLFDSIALKNRTFASYLRQKARLVDRPQYLMLFFHIDEVTSQMTGPDSHTQVDTAMVDHFTQHLRAFQRNGARFFTCSAARNHWLGRTSTEIQQQFKATEAS